MRPSVSQQQMPKCRVIVCPMQTITRHLGDSGDTDRGLRLLFFHGPQKRQIIGSANSHFSEGTSQILGQFRLGCNRDIPLRQRDCKEPVQSKSLSCRSADRKQSVNP